MTSSGKCLLMVIPAPAAPVADDDSSSHTVRQCHIVKWADFNGYGFNLHAQKERGGQYIGKIDPGSPAEDGGLREHDRIIEVNGANIEKETHQEVISRIKAGGEETKLLVVDREADNYFKSKGITVTSSMPNVKFLATARRSPRTSKFALILYDLFIVSHTVKLSELFLVVWMLWFYSHQLLCLPVF